MTRPLGICMRNKINTVILATLLGLGLGAALGFGPLQWFKSEGVLNMELGTSEYKRFTELANDAASINQYATIFLPARMNAAKFEVHLKTIMKGEWHKPIPKVSKADAKELPDFILQIERERERIKEKDKEKEKEKEKKGDQWDKQGNDIDKRKEASVYFGLRIMHMAHDPVEAAEVAIWLGWYFKEVAVREAVRELASKWDAENRQFSDWAVGQQFKYRFEIDQAQARSLALKKLAASYPDNQARQLVNVNKDNEKYMSPVSQLVAAESEIIELKEKTQKLNREISQHTFIAPLLRQAELSLKQVRTGSEGVEKLTAILAEYSKKVKTDAEHEKLLNITADVSQITDRFISQAQFIAQPSVANRPEKPTPLMYMALLGLIFAVLGAIYSWRKELINLLRDESVSVGS